MFTTHFLFPIPSCFLYGGAKIDYSNSNSNSTLIYTAQLSSIPLFKCALQYKHTCEKHIKHNTWKNKIIIRDDYNYAWCAHLGMCVSTAAYLWIRLHLISFVAAICQLVWAWVHSVYSYSVHVVEIVPPLKECVSLSIHNCPWVNPI